ncbi:MAG TPA: helix-turn-helix domain-containing protein [Pseudobacteroides sp.]|uniref:AraC family transcriptional regulator n=1 Tax=Pseudobacteroides sp. TaxID=1968840 RepID=UPI002F950C05
MYSYAVESEFLRSNIDLSIYYFGKEKCIPRHFWIPGQNNYYIMCFVLSGNGALFYDNESYEISRGTGFLITPQKYSYYISDDGNPWTFCWIGFTGVSASLCLSKAYISGKNPIFYFKDIDLIENVFDTMSNCNQITIGKDLKYLSLVYFLLSQIIEDSAKRSMINLKENAYDVYIKQAVDYITKNYPYPININSVAKQICISRKYLSKIFKEALNISPKEFLIKYRISKACEFLINSSRTINEIAYDVGYNDFRSFSKAFKKSIGVSPKEYKSKCS